MRQMISGLVAAFAVMAASAVPAMACGGGLFQSSCSPCGQAYVPCAQPEVYVAPAPVYSGCNTGCGGWGHERLADPVHQYYYVNQGPTFTGPGNWAPEPSYEESAIPQHYGYAAHRYSEAVEGPAYGYRAHRHWGGHTGYYAPHRYGYGHRYGYAPHAYGHRSMRYGYGAGYGMPHHYGYAEPHHYGYGQPLRRYY
jgi:hypothetical protein